MMKNERLGLAIIGASLAVIGIVIGLLFEYQRASLQSHIQTQGAGLMRLLSGMPYDRLAYMEQSEGILQLLKHVQGSNFAYGAIADKNGQPLKYVTAQNTSVPPAGFSQEPAGWIGDRLLNNPEDGRPIREFHAPIISSGELLGYVRAGYFEPRYAIDMAKGSFFATLALPIFLLTTLFYLLVRRETAPLHILDTWLRGHLDVRNYQDIDPKISGGSRDLIDHFNRFIHSIGNRIRELESTQSNLLLSTNVLSYKRAKIESVLQAFPDAIVMLDESGIVTYANAKVEPLLGINAQALMGRKLDEWRENGDLPTFFQAYQNHSAVFGRSNAMEFSPTQAPDKHIHVSASPLLSPNDTSTLMGSLVVFRDITSQAMDEKARGEFVAHLAHELKSPLNVLRMYSEMLLGEDGRKEEFRVEAVNIIHDEVDRLAALIANLLNIHKIETGNLALNLQRVKLLDLLQDAFDSVSRLGQEAGLDFRLKLPHKLSPLSIDKDLFRIAINNLLTNAIKYNRPAGSVILSAEETADAILIHVRDTGIGISQEDQPRVFEKFFRVGGDAIGNASGHGLGLPLAKQIIEMHRGRLTVESQPNIGTEFTIQLSKTHRLVQEGI
jgi:PAS domain S-box-containing protein